MWTIAVVATDSWDPATIQKEQLSDPDLGPTLEETEAGQHPEWKDIANCSPMYKGYWAHWKSLTVRDVEE
jgi:hypothetical protein